MSDLRVDWCDFNAAIFAVTHWHYSKSMPSAKRVNIGIWENGAFVGAVVYGIGANRSIGLEFGLNMFSCTELCRVALAPDRVTPTTQILAATRKLLKSHSPNLHLIVSYADVDQQHHGGLYQADNWVYLGMTQLNGGSPKFKIHGKVLHGKQIRNLYGAGVNVDWLRKHVDPNAERFYTLGKHKYVYPLDKRMRKQVLPLSQPYPKPDATTEMDS